MLLTETSVPQPERSEAETRPFPSVTKPARKNDNFATTAKSHLGVRPEWHWLDLVRKYFSELMRVKDADKPQIYFQVFESAELADLNYWLQVILSISIATLGLILSSPAVVIGAMLISPLMGPIFGLGLALALGDFYLGLKSLINLVLSTAASILLAALITWLLPFHVATPEILARVQPSLLDLAVAVLSGLAGAIVVCRGGTGGGVTALPGVAVAVALMPPLGVVGFGMGSGWNWEILSGGGLLFLTNLVAIILSSVLVFFVVRMDAPGVRSEITERLAGEEISDTFYNLMQHSPLRRLLVNVGTLPRRISILLIFLGAVCFPLVRTFNRIVADAKMRRIVLHDVERAVPKESLFQEEVEIGREQIKVRIVAVLAKGFSDVQRQQLQDDIHQRTGRSTEVSVFAVATRDELTEIAGQTSKNNHSPIALESVAELQKRIWLQIKPALDSVWPSENAPLLDASVTAYQKLPAMQASLIYLADEDLGALGQQAIGKNLGERLGGKLQDIRFQRIPVTWKISFQRNSDSLSPQSADEVQALIAALRRFPQLKCVMNISALPDTVDPLAQKRFQAFVKILAAKEVSADRISQGAEEPPENTALLRMLAPQS